MRLLSVGTILPSQTNGEDMIGGQIRGDCMERSSIIIVVTVWLRSAILAKCMSKNSRDAIYSEQQKPCWTIHNVAKSLVVLFRRYLQSIVHSVWLFAADRSTFCCHLWQIAMTWGYLPLKRSTRSSTKRLPKLWYLVYYILFMGFIYGIRSR